MDAASLLNLRLAGHHSDQAGESFAYVQGECGECDRIVSMFSELADGAVTVEVEGDAYPDAAKAKSPAGANAPYKIFPVGKTFVVKNNMGEVKATFKTKPKALAYLAALYANVKGASKRAAKTPFTGTAKNRFRDGKTAKAELAKDFTAGARKKAAAKGQARSDGSFPIETKADLKNAVQAFGRAKNKAAAKAHIIRRAKKLGATNLLPEGWMTSKASDNAAHDHARITCPEEGCPRSFHDEAALMDHADSVHTFDDIRRAVQSEVREKFGRRGDYRAEPPIPSIYTWVEDLADDWVVFSIESDGPDNQLMKAAYTIDETGNVTIGTPVEVVRRTVYDAVGTNSRAETQAATTS